MIKHMTYAARRRAPYERMRTHTVPHNAVNRVSVDGVGKSPVQC